MGEDVARGEQAGPATVAAWVTYDVGNALFFTGIVGLFFPLWVTGEMGGDDATVGYTLAAAMAINLIAAPIVGAYSDQSRRRIPFLAIFTLLCVGATLVLGGDNLNLSLALFAVAVISLSTADIFYNAMLTQVSTEENRGKIGGLGVGIGYLGAILAVAIGLVFVDTRGYEFGFRAIGVLVLLASLPLLVLAREQTSPTKSLTPSEIARGTVDQLSSTLSIVRDFPGLGRFLFARFWYSWVLYTASTFAVLYAIETVEFDVGQAQIVLLVGILVAVPSGLAWGMIVDRIGPRITMIAVLSGWLVFAALAVAIPLLDIPNQSWFGIAALGGLLVAGLWAADRPFLLRLTSREYLGEFFGLHSMASRLGAIVGPFTWGYLSVTLGLGQPAAMLSLLGCGVIALLLIRGVSDRAVVPSEEPVRDP